MNLNNIYKHILLSKFNMHLNTKSRVYSSKISPFKIASKKLRPRSSEKEFVDFHPSYQNFQELGAKSDYFNSPTLSQLERNYDSRDIQMKLIEKKLRFKTIESKYFRPKQEVNLLTWDMKQQIHQLHSLDPETWNLWVLTKVFPVKSEALKKLLRNKPKSLSPEKINEYDLKVIENWKNISDGRIGNLALLKKIINDRISGKSNSTLPAIKHEIAADPSFLKDLKFMDNGETNAMEFQGTPVANKKAKRRSFKYIIESYEDKICHLNSKGKDASKEEEESLKIKEIDKLGKIKSLPLDRIPATAATDLVTTPSLTITHNTLPRRASKKLLTFDEYKKLKDSK